MAIQEVDPVLGMGQPDPDMVEERGTGSVERRAFGQQRQERPFGDDPDRPERQQLDVARLERRGGEPHGQVTDRDVAAAGREPVDHERPPRRPLSQAGAKVSVDAELDRRGSDDRIDDPGVHAAESANRAVDAQ